MKNKKILDVCCGGRMFWFNKKHPNALFLDKRRMKKQIIWQKGNQKREFEIIPDMVMDFRDLKLPDNSFSLVVFDPPHCIKRNGKTGWMNKKYGSLDCNSWQEDLRMGFGECFRVLKPDGILIFKWSTVEIPLSKILKLTQIQPLFGHKSGKKQKTHWLCFMKIENNYKPKTSA